MPWTAFCMVTEMIFSSKGFCTSRSFERFLASMSKPMSPEMIRHTESFAAVFTRIWFVARVGARVILQCRECSESFITNFALEWLFPSIGSSLIHQAKLSVENFWAKLT